MPIIIKGKLLTKDSPLVCVSVTGETTIEIMEQAREAVNAGIPVIEWRADYYNELSDNQALRDILEKLRSLTSDTIFITTVRTTREGGKADLSSLEMYRVLNEIATAHAADLIDVEFDTFDDPLPLTQLLHHHGAMVISSHHDFNSTPSEDEVIAKLNSMKETDADIVKIAVTPSNKADAFSLMKAISKFTESETIPVIGISMGNDGMISRIIPSAFGSCLTFGKLGDASAPGQPDALLLTNALSTIKEII